MKQIRVAILGQGRSGRNIHGDHLSKDERYKIVVVADLLADRRERAKKEFGCEAVEDYRDIFARKDIDLIINATQSHTHYPITKEFLEHGFNVLSEKPFAKTAEQVDDLIATAAKNKVLLAAFQQSRFAPYFVKAKEIADSGILGRIVYVQISFDGFGRRWDWQTMKSKNAGNLYNTGPHPVDQALRFLDYDGMPQVFCHMDSTETFGDAEDFDKLLLKAPGRPLVEVNTSSCAAFPNKTYNIYGTLGGLTGSMTHLDWKYIKPEELEERKLIPDPLKDENGLPMYCGETLNWYTDSWDAGEGFELFPVICSAYYNMLYATLTEGKPLVVTPEQVRQQIAIIEECHRQNPAYHN